MSATQNPTRRIDVDLQRWVERRQARQAKHLVDGVPDYAFSLDLSMRRRLEALAPLRMLAQSILSGAVPIARALHEAKGVAVGPNQLPKVHAMGVNCAERLGIGVPQIFIYQDPIANAFTLATGDVDQIVVLTSGLVQALDDDELRFVIGHECGHIHNQHVVYNTLWEMLTNRVVMRLIGSALGMFGPLGTLAQLGLVASSWLLLGRWHRCAEITCDRAGMICVDDPAAAERWAAKIQLGGLGSLEGFDEQAYANQLRSYSSSWLRLQELAQTHPLGPHRAEASRLFRETDVWAAWRPDHRAQSPLSKAEIDGRVEKLFL